METSPCRNNGCRCERDSRLADRRGNQCDAVQHLNSKSSFGNRLAAAEELLRHHARIMRRNCVVEAAEQ